MSSHHPPTNGAPARVRVTRGITLPDFTVHAYGTDTSGRAIFMTAFMHDWFEQVVDDLGFRPTIVQGAFMARAGGGADASAGYHDQGGCLDLRIWDLTQSQVQKTVRTLRRHGAAAWVRDKTHGGMDPHIHLVLGADYPLARGAALQWQQYLAGRDGLASNGRDYHWRPDPLITKPPEDDMPYTEQQLTKIIRQAVRDEIKPFKQRMTKRHQRVLAELDALADQVKDDATKKQIRNVRADIAALADDEADEGGA